ncbi:MAG: extracellular solute-binding protein [Lachnospiraceae bacterium]|nr:extracellular solute-binding protein [Lachnospiraceae bacterium]
MKKIMALVMSTVVAASLLAGCGSAAGESTPAAESKETAAADTAKEEAATVEAASEQEASDASGEIYMFISSPEYADAINELIDAYKEVAPNVTINYETTQNDYPTLLKAKLNSGEVPDIFSSTSGKEIDTYLEYSYDLSGEALMETMDPAVAAAMSSTENGGTGCYGIAIKGNYFGIVYNKAIFEEVGISEFPKTISGLEEACEKIAAAGYRPFTTGFAEWWVFKHTYQSFVNAAADGAGISTAELVQKFEKGEAKVSDYPELYDNYFKFLELATRYGDEKPLETDLAAEEAALATGEAAMTLGQGAWIEADCLAINPDLQIGFAGYPTTEDAAECKVISGSDQALHISKDSPNLQATLDFVNWWYTSEYGMGWFNDVAGVVPPIVSDAESEFEIIKQGSALAAADGAGALAICYSTDSWHQTCGQILQSYLAGEIDKDAACAKIEEQWKAIDGAQ